jgi:hypothetical protein
VSASDLGPVASASASSSALSVTHQNPVSARIISLLNIADHLVDRRTSGLRISYAKYLAYIEAQQSLAKLVSGGGWPASQKKPKSEDLIEVFISRSTFFKNYLPPFPHVPDYPDLQRWLKNEENVPTDLEAWGMQKNIYTFKDLEEVLDRMEEKKESGGKKANKSKKKGDKAGNNKKANRDF